MMNASGIRLGAAVPALTRWGLTADADLVYRSINTFGPQRVTTLVRDLGMPRARIASALEELHATGIAGVGTDQSGERDWHVVPAGAAAKRLQQHYARPNPIPAGVASPAHALLRRLHERPDVYATRLSDRKATRERIAQLVRIERTEHLSMNPEPTLAVEALTVATPHDLDLLRRGVSLRSLGRTPDDGPLLSDRGEQFIQCGGRYRQTRRLPYKMMIFDRRVALLALDPANLDHGALEITDPAMVTALVELFEKHYAVAVDPPRTGGTPMVLTPREKAVITLLTEGHTDSSAARELGISTRSVTYTLRALMDRLGVDNRFQLGLALGTLQVMRSPHFTETCDSGPGHVGV